MCSDQTRSAGPSNLFPASGAEHEKFINGVVEELSKHNRPIERPPDADDNSNTLHFVEQYTLETEKAPGKLHLTR